MAPEEERPVGLTRDTGYQIGARRTLPVPLEEAWRFLTSAEGLALWLGEAAVLDFDKGEPYRLDDGASGEMRVFKPGSHLRLTWQRPDYPRPSTIQVRVIPKGERTTVAFHQEHLPSAEARAARRAHYHAVLDRLEAIFRPE